MLTTRQTRKVRPAQMRGHVEHRAAPLPEWLMSTAQGFKSPASSCSGDCSQGRSCTCAAKPKAIDRISAVRIALLIYAIAALAYFFAS